MLSGFCCWTFAKGSIVKDDWRMAVVISERANYNRAGQICALEFFRLEKVICIMLVQIKLRFCYWHYTIHNFRTAPRLPRYMITKFCFQDSWSCIQCLCISVHTVNKGRHCQLKSVWRLHIIHVENRFKLLIFILVFYLLFLYVIREKPLCLFVFLFFCTVSSQQDHTKSCWDVTLNRMKYFLNCNK